MKTTKNKKGKRPKQKWKTNQSTKINLIGCDTIVNSPSLEVINKKKSLRQSNSILLKSWMNRSASDHDVYL